MNTYQIRAKRTPIQKAWLDYGGDIKYLNNQDDPLDLKTFRKAMGGVIKFEETDIGEEHREEHPKAKPKHHTAALPEQGSSATISANIATTRVEGDSSNRRGSIAPKTHAGSGEETGSEDHGEGDSDYVEEGNSSDGEAKATAKMAATSAGKVPAGASTGTAGRGKKRKSAENVDDDAAVSGEEASKRPKPYQPGRYDPPCERCANEGRTECMYDNYGNACRRCKHPSKLACSYSLGTRTSGKPANRSKARASSTITKKAGGRKATATSGTSNTSANGTHSKPDNVPEKGDVPPSSTQQIEATSHKEQHADNSVAQPSAQDASSSKSVQGRRTNPTRSKSSKGKQKEGEQASPQQENPSKNAKNDVSSRRSWNSRQSRPTHCLRSQWTETRGSPRFRRPTWSLSHT